MTQYVLHEVPVGTLASGTRRETDSVGSIDVPADKYWGGATQRALRILPSNQERLPDRLFSCFGYVKRAAAIRNCQAGRLPKWKAAAIVRAADDLIAGLLREHFPLPVYQSGSGLDADTNVNEVLANRSAQLLGRPLGKRSPIDPIRDVNLAQSVVATFDASMQVATVLEIEETLAPRGSALAREFDRSPNLLLAHAARLRASLSRLDEAEGGLHELGLPVPQADLMTATITGDWKTLVGTIAADTKRPFIGTEGSCAGDTMVAAMAAVRGVAFVLHDAAELIRSTLGAVQPLRTVASIDALSMICWNIIGQDLIVEAGCRDNLLHITRPLIGASVLRAIGSLAEACGTLRRLVIGMR